MNKARCAELRGLLLAVPVRVPGEDDLAYGQRVAATVRKQIVRWLAARRD